MNSSTASKHKLESSKPVEVLDLSTENQIFSANESHAQAESSEDDEIVLRRPKRKFRDYDSSPEIPKYQIDCEEPQTKRRLALKHRKNRIEAEKENCTFMKLDQDELCDLTRYTKIILNLMPSFHTAPRAGRLHIKEQVELYLRNRLGSDQIRDCVTWARSADGKLFSTFGIPLVLHHEFKEWMVDKLKATFSAELVQEVDVIDLTEFD
jgi:hypothetical protein